MPSTSTPDHDGSDPPPPLSPDHHTTDTTVADPSERVRRRRNRIVLVVALSLLLVPVLAVAGGGWLVLQKVTGDIQRIPNAMPDVADAVRPPRPATGKPGAEGVTFLLAGLDRRSGVPTTGTDARAALWVPGAARTDANLIVHITGDRRHAYVISIPRDSWVPIPGHGKDKINAAFSFGGPSLYVQTVEELTRLRVDHLAIIDWNGFSTLTDALGGVRLTFKDTTPARGQTFPPGTHLLSGADALDYVGERKRLANGDFGRIDRQQNYLRAMVGRLLSGDTVSDPGRLKDVLGAISRTTSVDDQLSNNDLISLAFSVRDLRSQDITFLTVPTSGVGTAGGASIVRYDGPRADTMFAAVKQDRLPQWLADNGGADELPAQPL